jgi:hypothetical protein
MVKIKSFFGFLVVFSMVFAAGCISSSENDSAGAIPTTIVQVPSTLPLTHPTISTVQESYPSMLTTVVPVNLTIPPDSSNISEVHETRTTPPSDNSPGYTIVKESRTFDPSAHLYIIDFDTEPVTVRQNDSFTVEVSMKAINWEPTGICAGFYCSDNLDTIPINLKILNYPDKKIPFNSFGLGGGKKGSADFHVGFWINDLPAGKYTLEFSTPDSVVRKNVSVT